MPSHKPPELDELEIRAIAGEVRTNSWVTLFYGLLHMDIPVLAKQQKIIFINSMWTLDSV